MLNTGIVAKAKSILHRMRYGQLNYAPRKMVTAARLILSKSQAWTGLEKIILDIIEFSKMKREKALEFGVEFGYSIAVLANYFKQVKGVDILTGAPHAGYFGDIHGMTKSNLSDFNNIELIKSDYSDHISSDNRTYDLIHVDIVHTYEDTFTCGMWSAERSHCTIFHDTLSLPVVKKAVAEIAKKTFYNYRKCNGLGIVI